MVLAFDRGQLLHAPLLHLAPCCLKRVLWSDGVGIKFFEQVSLFRLRLRPGRPARERPCLGENLQRWTETGEIEIDSAYSSFLELFDFRPNCLSDGRLHLFPVASFRTR